METTRLTNSEASSAVDTIQMECTPLSDNNMEQENGINGSSSLSWKLASPVLRHDPSCSGELDPYTVIILSQLWNWLNTHERGVFTTMQKYCIKILIDVHLWHTSFIDRYQRSMSHFREIFTKVMWWWGCRIPTRKPKTKYSLVMDATSGEIFAFCYYEKISDCNYSTSTYRNAQSFLLLLNLFCQNNIILFSLKYIQML